MKSCGLSRRTAGASARVRVSLAVVALAALSGGCAATQPGPSYVAGPVTTFPGDLPPLPPPASQTTRVEIEADGLPAQLAPRNPRPVKDDPSEPWSPNYGKARPAIAEAVPVIPQAANARVASIPVASTRADANLDADDIIRRAIAEHEMRQR
jgi:hypothetical protein